MCRSLTNNSSKKICALLLVFLLAAGTLVGCTQNGETPTGRTEFDLNPILLETSHITLNQIEIEEVSVYSNGEPREEEPPSYYEYDQMSPEEKKAWQEKEIFFSGNYLRIDGLKDKEVQDAINKKIKQLYFDNIGYLPPYRGVKVMFGDDPKPRTDTYSMMSMYAESNFNNILSITLHCSIPYEYKDAKNSEYNYEHVAWVVPLNIDLNTGEEITLKQVFHNHVDAIEYLNYAFTKTTAGSYDGEGFWGGVDDLQLVGRFDTLAEDQKYSITPYGLRLILDYEIPVADIGFYYQSMIVPYSNEMAILERFLTENKSLYTSQEKPEKNLLVPEMRGDQYLETSEVADGIDIYLRASYSSKMPEMIIDRIQALYEKDRSAEIEKVKPYYQEARAEFGRENSRAEFRSTIDAGVAGPFGTLYILEYTYAGGDDGRSYREFYAKQSNRYETYDLTAQKSEPMTLEDLFVSGTDAEAYIKEAMVASIRATVAEQAKNRGMTTDMPVFGQGEKKEKDAAYIDRLYESINGFVLQSNMIIFSYDENTEEIYKQVYEVESIPEENTSYAYSINLLPYTYLDSDKMTIFR